MFQLCFLILIFAVSSVKTESPTCTLPCTCNDTSLYDVVVGKYCTKHEGFMLERCCIRNNTIIGLALQNCDVQKLNVSQPRFYNVEIMDLTDNDDTRLSSEQLLGLLKLDYLYLPQHMTCPGGDSAWNETSTDHNITSCCGQLDPCVALNITCGEEDDASCHHLGPASAKCICAPGHFGYKCLNYGEFPIAIFSSSVVFPTIVLSIVLWFVQGRDPYRKM